MSTSATTDARTAGPVLAALLRWAEELPLSTAVSAPDGAFDYVQLADRTRRLAAAMATRGIGPERRVALLLGRSRDSLAALLAVWWLGATAVPLDPGHPAERLRYILRDGGVELVVTAQAPDWLPPELAILHPEQPAPAAPAALPVRPYPDGAAYLIYTSGTTGRPKGVEVTYGGLAAFADALGGIGLPSTGLGLNAVSPAFDGWLWCSLLYLLHGQGVAMVDLTLEAPAHQGPEPIRAAAVRTVSLTPSLLAAHGDQVTGAEVIVVAGEPCPPALADRFAPGRRFLNVYGPTEATIAATWSDSVRGDDVHTIGRPLPGYRAYVLDAELRPVPPGTEGELFLGGPALARGYRGRAGLTAARFIPDVFRADGSRMYRTGDVVRELPSGELEYRGRRDDQVKVRGFRVELGEVERAARELPQVAASAAFVVGSGDALGLAVVPAPGAAAAGLAERVAAHCATLLPAAAVPQTVQVRDGIPTLATGKADRAALASEAASAPVAVGTGRPPATERERELLALWSELLDRQIDGASADFFELGGHSLLAARMVAELRRRTGLPVSLGMLLANPTAAALAAELDALATAESVGVR
ncbi:non-ribosomal peptide synthetase [Kitasatospora acidiphila]|uniref:Non-ribosomal peptide synthetase n=1 Tax=Kitasatospora acidiphila TaxID=2567942 RepID=A0A540VYR9_9ACTN|nr:non-ribosomal peptide synthetase [Kitasatospora acidiphila]TQF01905.1 non-ribosomal peptide synthetase [Kitasatospora acidiphila]